MLWQVCFTWKIIFFQSKETITRFNNRGTRSNIGENESEDNDNDN